MTDQVLYFFSKTRKQRSKLYIRMGLFCWVYVIGLLLYEEFGDKSVPDDLHLAMVIAFPVASAILFLVAWWHIRKPCHLSGDDYSRTVYHRIPQPQVLVV